MPTSPKPRWPSSEQPVPRLVRLPNLLATLLNWLPSIMTSEQVAVSKRIPPLKVSKILPLITTPSTAFRLMQLVSAAAAEHIAGDLHAAPAGAAEQRDRRPAVENYVAGPVAGNCQPFRLLRGLGDNKCGAPGAVRFAGASDN